MTCVTHYMLRHTYDFDKNTHVSLSCLAGNLVTLFCRDSWIFYVNYITLVLRDVIHLVPMVISIDI